MNEKYMTKIIAASLLGDGTVHIPNDGSINAKYAQTKTVDHIDYLDWFQERLETITAVSRYSHQSTMPNAKLQWFIQTRQHPFYTKFRHRMYPNGIKVVDPHYLTLIDWEFLAILYQEDGSITSRFQGNYQDIQVNIATMGFSYGDNLLLKQAFKEKLNIEWNLRQYKKKHGGITYYLALLRSSLPRFIENVTPFIVPSHMYKVQTITPFNKKGEEIV